MCIGGLSQTYKKYLLTANHVFDYLQYTLYIHHYNWYYYIVFPFWAESTSINTTTNNTALIVIRKNFKRTLILIVRHVFFCDLHFNLRVVWTLPFWRVSDMVPLKSGSLLPHVCLFLFRNCTSNFSTKATLFGFSSVSFFISTLYHPIYYHPAIFSHWGISNLNIIIIMIMIVTPLSWVYIRILNIHEYLSIWEYLQATSKGYPKGWWIDPW